MKIIVTGSLGNIAQPLTKQLIANGHSVTVVTSKQEKSKDIETIGAKAVVGLLTDSAFLSTAFTGADAVYTMVPPNFGAPDARKYYQEIANAYLTAIRNAGVKRVVNLSSIGADLDKGTGFILGSHDEEQILNKLTGVELTHLRPAYFYYNLLNFIGLIKGLGFITANYGGDDRIVMVSPLDIAHVAAEELTASGSTATVRYIASADHTGNEVAQVLGTAIGKPDLKWVLATDEQAAQGMIQAGMPKHVVDNFIEMGNSIHTGILYRDYNKQNLKPAGNVTLEDFAKDFASSYNS